MSKEKRSKEVAASGDCSSVFSPSSELSAVENGGAEKEMRDEGKERKSQFVIVMPTSIILSLNKRVSETQLHRLSELWVNNLVLSFTQQLTSPNRHCLIGEMDRSRSLTPKVCKLSLVALLQVL